MNQMAPIAGDKAQAGKRVAARLADVIRKDRIMIDPLMTYAYSGDASSYRLVPACVVIVNTEDVFVRPYVYDDTARWVSRLWRRDIRAGHWSPLSHPEVLATAVAEFIGHLDGAPASPALVNARVAGSA